MAKDSQPADPTPTDPRRPIFMPEPTERKRAKERRSRKKGRKTPSGEIPLPMARLSGPAPAPAARISEPTEPAPASTAAPVAPPEHSAPEKPSSPPPEAPTDATPARVTPVPKPPPANAVVPEPAPPSPRTTTETKRAKPTPRRKTAAAKRPAGSKSEPQPPSSQPVIEPVATQRKPEPPPTIPAPDPAEPPEPRKAERPSTPPPPAKRATPVTIEYLDPEPEPSFPTEASPPPARPTPIPESSTPRPSDPGPVEWSADGDMWIGVSRSDLSSFLEPHAPPETVRFVEGGARPFAVTVHHGVAATLYEAWAPVPAQDGPGEFRELEGRWYRRVGSQKGTRTEHMLAYSTIFEAYPILREDGDQDAGRIITHDLG